jgi:hypothetical protein
MENAEACGVLVLPEDKTLKQRVVLSQEQAIEIYRLKETHGFSSQHTASTKLSRRYNVSPKAIRDIWKGRSWLSATSFLWKVEELPPRKFPGRPRGKKDSRPRKRKTPDQNNEPTSQEHGEPAERTSVNLWDPEKYIENSPSYLESFPARGLGLSSASFNFLGDTALPTEFAGNFAIPMSTSNFDVTRRMYPLHQAMVGSSSNFHREEAMRVVGSATSNQELLRPILPDLLSQALSRLSGFDPLLTRGLHLPSLVSVLGSPCARHPSALDVPNTLQLPPIHNLAPLAVDSPYLL